MSIPLRYGTTFQVMLVVVLAGILVDEMCQFLLGTVQLGQRKTVPSEWRGLSGESVNSS